MPNRKRNGNGRKGRNNRPMNSGNRLRSGQVVDFTKFAARRRVKFIVPIPGEDSQGINYRLTTIDRLLNATRAIPSVRQFLDQFVMKRLVSLRVHFDNRFGANNPRLAAFLLPGTASNYTGDNLNVAEYGGPGRMQMSRRGLTLRVGPEFDIGRFSINNSAITLVTQTAAYNTGTDISNSAAIRAEVTFEVLGPPVQVIAPVEPTLRSDDEEKDSQDDHQNKVAELIHTFETRL